MLQGQKWFNKINKNKSDLFNKKILHEIKKHKEAGAGIVLVSGSFPPCLDPLAKYIGADYLLASKLETKQGVITGNLLPPQCIGRGKMTAIELFMSSQNSDNYQDCFAYSDHISDLAMLERVGNPVVVLNDPILATHASNKGWKIISNASEDNNRE